MVCSRPRPPVRSAAAIRSSASRYACRSSGTAPVMVVSRAATLRSSRPSAVGASPSGSVRQHRPLPGVGDQVVAERGRGAEHRDQPAAQPGVGGQRVAYGHLVAGAPLGLDQPVQLTQRQVRVGGPGQRGEQLGGAFVGRLLRRRAATGRARPGRAGRRRAWRRRPRRSRTGPGARGPGRVTVSAPSSGRLRRGLSSPSSPSASAANRAANGCHASSTSAITAVAGGHHQLRVVAQLGQQRRVAGPLGDHRGVALDVELQAPGPVAEAERLVRVAGGRGQQRRAVRQLGDLVGVPLEHVGHQRHVPEQRVVLGGVAPADQRRADLRPGRAALDQAGVRGGEQLRAEADRRASAPAGGPPCAAAPPAPGTRARRARRRAPGTPAGRRRAPPARRTPPGRRGARRRRAGAARAAPGPPSVSHSPRRRRSSVGSFSITSAVATTSRLAGTRRQRHGSGRP